MSKKETILFSEFPEVSTCRLSEFKNLTKLKL